MTDPVRDYFDRTAAEFDAIHDREGVSTGTLIDRIFRPGMRERYEYVLARTRPDNQSFLDVGCGGGKYAVAFAARGLKVTGIDFAPGMLELARQRAAAAGVAGRCQWLAGDVLTSPVEPADLVLAIGVFDYVRDPAPLLARLKELARRELIASFPRAGTWQGVLRRAWLLARGCPVRYYRVEEARGLTAAWNGTVTVVESIRGDYLLHWTKD